MITFSFFPQAVYKTQSDISGEIVVKEQFGQHKLYVNGVIQSGGIVKGIWKKPLNKIHHSKFIIQNSLILGLGGGTAVHLIRVLWPEAKIVGIEIDPEIIKIGKKYFGLDKNKNLKIINADALEWLNFCLNDSNHLNGFDLVLVDLYIGSKLEKKAESEAFLKKLKKTAAKKGLIIFNWLKNRDSRKFHQTLKKVFAEVEAVESHSNKFFIVGG